MYVTKAPLIQGFNSYFLFFQVSPNSTVSSYCIHYLLSSRITSAAVSASAEQSWTGQVYLTRHSTTTSGKTFHKRTVEGENV